MDYQLPADVLDVDLWQEPVAESSAMGASRSLAVASLVSGKVMLLDYSRLAHASREVGAGGERTDDDGAGVQGSQTDMAGSGTLPETLCARTWTVKSGSKSCRSSRFSTDGRSVFSISKDRSISQIDTETGQISRRWKLAHDAPPSVVLPVSETMLATGDDEGTVKFWDPRDSDRSGDSDGKETARSVQSYSEHSDWITDMIWAEHINVALPGPRKGEKRTKGAASSPRARLICVSGDGHLSMIDPTAGRKGLEMSEDQEDELLSIRAIKRGDKFVVGTSLGPLSIWAPSKGMLDHVDRLAGHPASIDSIDVLDEDTVLTGSSDGLVRIVQVYPHKLLGIAADHGGFPVERAVHSGDYLASIGHENFVRFTNLRSLLGDDYDQEDGDADQRLPDEDAAEDGETDDESSDGQASARRRRKKAKKTTTDLQHSGNDLKDTGFFSEL